MGDVKNLTGKDAIEKMKKMVEDVNTCMFCTDIEQLPFPTRPMATQKVDDEGNFWFLSSKTSNKEHEIKDNSKVQLIYAHPHQYEFMSVYGVATSFYDRGKIEELWTPIAKTWFPEGKDDPNLTLIKVSVNEAYYWDTKHGKLVSLFKIVAGAMGGSVDDGGVEGKMNV
ncbi:MAG TPA: pyridoxamine 5'-phosphate oxidase family protein [Flavipsychrobacter sp.]|nr:pyridoxamine 5'-phosphate oxidase family protein [Flavipsychrobacter sp.]